MKTTKPCDLCGEIFTRDHVVYQTPKFCSLNHDPTDDRIENLEKTDQSTHMAEHIRGWVDDDAWRSKLRTGQQRRRARERTERQS